MRVTGVPGISTRFSFKMELDGKVLENVHSVAVAENKLSDLKRTADQCQQLVENAAREKSNAENVLRGAWDNANRNVADMESKILEGTQRMNEFESAVTTQQGAVNPRMDRTKKYLDDVREMLDVALTTIGSGILNDFNTGGAGQINDEAQVAIRNLQEKLEERRKAIAALQANIKASREKAARIRGAMNADIDHAYDKLREKMTQKIDAAKDAIGVFERMKCTGESRMNSSQSNSKGKTSVPSQAGMIPDNSGTTSTMSMAE